MPATEGLTSKSQATFSATTCVLQRALKQCAALRPGSKHVNYPLQFGQAGGRRLLEGHCLNASHAAFLGTLHLGT